MARRYDSPVRRERAALTRERIVDAGAALVHEFPSWDWRALTVRAVADRAGVHERTVYRYFPTEQLLRAAVVDRLEQEAGLRPEDVTFDTIEEHLSGLFGYLASFSSTGERPTDEALVAVDERRKSALLEVIAAETPAWTERDRRLAAAVIDVLWGVPTYRRLVGGWGLDDDDAAAAATWVVRLVLDEIRAARSPSSADVDRKRLPAAHRRGR